MVVQTAELFFNDAPSRYNKDLTDFLERNIQTIITKGQIMFRFKIAKGKELSRLRSRGISRLPAMVLQNKPFIGVPIIVEELRKRVKRSKTVAAVKSEEEVLADYFQKTLGNIQYDDEGKHIIPIDDDSDGDEPDLLNAYNAEVQRRGSGDRGAHRGASRNAPSKPDRMAVQDNDYDESYAAPPRQQRPPRQNNVDEPEAGNPIAVLNQLTSKNKKSSQDDDMMRTLLERMSPDSGFEI